jgi:quercetin dioxygenase-like cupin family protein
MTPWVTRVMLCPSTMLQDRTAPGPDPEVVRMIDEGGPVSVLDKSMIRTGLTSGSSRRSGRSLTGQGLTYELPGEVRALRSDLSRTSGGRAAKTLVKADNLRVVLIALRAGTTLDPHAIAGAASLHVLDGRLAVQVAGHSRAVQAGTFVVLSENLHEPVVALEDAVLLATVAWPDRAGAWGLDMVEGHQ